MEEYYGQKPIIADIDLVGQADVILEGADERNIAYLVAGTTHNATTHKYNQLILSANKKNIEYKLIPNNSIRLAVLKCGLNFFSFSKSIYIPYWNDTSKPDSFFETILTNYKRNCHTLCLLDMKVKEPKMESLTKKSEYMPQLFMSVNEAAAQLLEIIENLKENEAGISKESLCVGLARLDYDDEKIVVCSLEKMASVDLGAPLHCMVIAAPTLHPTELALLKKFRI